MEGPRTPGFIGYLLADPNSIATRTYPESAWKCTFCRRSYYESILLGTFFNPLFFSFFFKQISHGDFPKWEYHGVPYPTPNHPVVMTRFWNLCPLGDHLQLPSHNSCPLKSHSPKPAAQRHCDTDGSGVNEVIGNKAIWVITIWSYGSVSKPCTPGEHQNSW